MPPPQPPSRIVQPSCIPTQLTNYTPHSDGGIKSQFVRDASGQLIGLMELGPKFYRLAARALGFMLTWLETWEARSGGYAPHVMVGNPPALDKIVSLDVIDEADDTFYLIAAWGRYVMIILLRCGLGGGGASAVHLRARVSRNMNT